MVLYILIFLSKVTENTLSTLRLIFVANGKKVIGAILNFIIALVWIFVTGAVIVNITEDYYKVIFFALGSLVGSYIGSLIEEKVALGSNMLFTIVDKKVANIINKNLTNEGNTITILKGNKYDNKIIMMIMVKRKQRSKVVNYIRKLDKESIIISENAYNIKKTNTNKKNYFRK